MASSLLALVLGLLPSGEPLRFDWDGEPLPAGAIARLGSFRGREPEGLHHLAAYCAARNLLATAGNDSLIRLQDATTGRRLPGLPLADAAVQALAFSPDGARLAVAGSTQIVLLDLLTGQKPRWLKDRTSAISGLLFSPDGRWLVALENREGVRVWHTATGKVWAYWKTPARELFQAAFSGDGRILAVLTSGETLKCEIRFWELGSGLEENPLLVDPEARTFVIWPDGQRLTVLASEETLLIYNRSQPSDSSTWKVPLEWPIRNTAGNTSLVLSPDGQSLALSGWLGIQLCEMELGKVKSLKRECRTGNPRLALLAFSPDMKKLLTWQKGDRLRSLDMSGKKELPYPGHEHPIRSLRLTPDGHQVVSTDIVGSTCVWDCTTWQERIPRDSDQARDKQEIALVAAKDAQQITMGRKLGILPTTIRDLAFSPDGHSLAVATNEGVGLWELATGKLRRCFTGHVGPVNAVLFSADGRRLFTGGEDWTVLVWEVALPSVDNAPIRPVELWHDLASDETEQAFRAMSRLIQKPRQALPLLRDQVAALRLAGSHLPADRLIGQLSSDSFDEREQAGQALLRLGSRARKDILAALQAGPSLDLERQLHRLLADIEDNHWTANELRQLRVVEVLEQLNAPEARQPLRTLATGIASERVGEAARAALTRLERRDGGSRISASTR